MMNTRSGNSLAAFVTATNIWEVLQFHVPIWDAWGANPVERVGILVLAGTSSATLCHIWAQILSLRRLQRSATPALIHSIREGSGV